MGMINFKYFMFISVIWIRICYSANAIPSYHYFENQVRKILSTTERHIRETQKEINNIRSGTWPVDRLARELAVRYQTEFDLFDATYFLNSYKMFYPEKSSEIEALRSQNDRGVARLREVFQEYSRIVQEYSRKVNN